MSTQSGTRAGFGVIQPEWYAFAYGKPKPKDPTQLMVTLKTSWQNVRKQAGVSAGGTITAIRALPTLQRAAPVTKAMGILSDPNCLG